METPAEEAARLDRDPPTLAEAVATAADVLELAAAGKLSPGECGYAARALLAAAAKAGLAVPR